MKQLGIIKVVETKTTIYQVQTNHVANGEDLIQAARLIHANDGHADVKGFEVTKITDTGEDRKYHLDYQLTQDRPKEQIKNASNFR